MIVCILYISNYFPLCYLLVLKTTYIRFSFREISRHGNEGEKGNDSMTNGFYIERKENQMISSYY